MKHDQLSEIQANVTDRIIACMEKGVSPWKCPWKKSNEPWMPYNYATKRAYNGINVLLLWLEAQEKGYSSNGWLTFDQAKSLGGWVKKGSKSVKCLFYRPIEVKDNGKQKKTNAAGEETDKKTVFIARAFPIFNLDQIEGIGETDDSVKDALLQTSDMLGCLDQMMVNYGTTGIKFEHGGNRAYYAPDVDLVRMPRLSDFSSEEGYAATFTHELIHSTGHQSRLSRFAKNSEMFTSTKEAYAFEELVAEIGAAYFSATLGLDGEYENHASYIDSWISLLKKDKRFIFKAATLAAQAQHFLMQYWPRTEESALASFDATDEDGNNQTSFESVAI